MALIKYEDYLAHYGTKGMKWGVRRSIKRDARERARAARSSGTGSTARKKAIKNKIEAKDQEIPGYKNAVIQRQRKMEVRKAEAVLIGTPIAVHLATHPEKIERGLRATGKALKFSAELGQVVIKASKEVYEGRKFAEEMGISGPKYVDSAGKILKNVNPNFG